MESDNIEVEIRLTSGERYTLIADLNTLVLDLKRRLVKHIASLNGKRYDSAQQIDTDAQRYGLMIPVSRHKKIVMLHSLPLTEYNNLLIAANNVIIGEVRRNICDDCWHKRAKCRHIEGTYPLSRQFLFDMDECSANL